MLSNRLRPPAASTTSPEDIFSDSLARLYPDDLPDHHGSPGSYLMYHTPVFTQDLELHLCDYTGEGERKLFAYHVWNSSLMLSQHIEENISGLFNVQGERLVELGAGSGLVSITAARCGAEAVVITDYPSTALIKTLRKNVEKNLTTSEACRVSVEPYKWGDLGTQLGRFTRVIASDCLWMVDEHENLVKSMLQVLSDDATDNARVWVCAGFHTGRGVVTSFFDTAGRQGLVIEKIWERNSRTGEEREWATERANEGVGERKVWCVLAILKSTDDRRK